MIHVLKADPRPFDDAKVGLKLFELRRADRDYRVGDTLLLLRTKHSSANMRTGAALEYTGDVLAALITHIQTGYGLPDGLAALSISPDDALIEQALESKEMPTDLAPLVKWRIDYLKKFAVGGGDRAKKRASFAEAAQLLCLMTQDEVKATQRFHETGADDGSYDISTTMRSRLRSLGLIKHVGGSRFSETDLMLEVIDLIERQEVV